MLPETDINRIREEAERLLKKNGLPFASDKSFKKAYIAAVTLYQERINAEREKAKVLVDGLKGMLAQFKPRKDMWNEMSAVEWAEDALDTYNKTINNG